MSMKIKINSELQLDVLKGIGTGCWVKRGGDVWYHVLAVAVQPPTGHAP